MSATLFDITGDFLEALELLERVEEGEAGDEEGAAKKALEEWLGKIAIDLRAKIDGYVWVLQEMAARAAAYREQEARFAAKRRCAERGAERLKERLRAAMELLGLDKVEGEHWAVAVVESPAMVEVVDPAAAISAGFGEVVEVPKVDKAAIRKAWQEDPARVGAFARVVQRRRLRIR